MTPRPPRWIGYIAGGLILAHATLSVYWAAGGTAGWGLLSEGIRAEGEAREAWFVALLWGIAALKSTVAFAALVLAGGWKLPVPRWLVLLAVWGTGVILTLYGTFMIGMMLLTGFVLEIGERESAFWAYLLLWAPLWLLIGVTFLLTGLASIRLRAIG
jgi:hypothetical protein